MRKHNLTLKTVLMFLAISSAAIAIVPAAHAAEDATSIPLWSDIQDVAQYAPKSMPDAALIARSASKDPRFVTDHAQLKFGVNVEYAPVLEAGETVYRATALISKMNVLAFRKYEIKVGGVPRKIQEVDVVQDIPLAGMNFEINTGLIERMLVLEDFQNEVTLVFPLGVGGVDDNIIGLGHRILTPLFHNAYIKVSSITAHRTFPTYFRGEPFMPITNANGLQTPIAFHITVLDDATWAAKGGNYLLRGFESHGCMRMRQKDVRQLYTVIKGTGQARIPVNVDYFVWKRNASGVRDQSLGQVAEINPYPLVSSNYQGILNFASAGQKPVYQRDPVEHLIEMGEIERKPDLTHLRDFNADDLRDLSAFDGLSQDLNNDH